MSESGEHRVLLDLKKSAREQLRVSVAQFKGVQYVHIRNWYSNHDGEKHQPGKGIALRLEQLAQVIEALRRAGA